MNTERAASSRPSSCSAEKLPIVACPQRSTSVLGVKKRTLKSALSDGVTKAVSLRFISRATFCICPSSSPSAAVTTPAGLPPNGTSVNASTCLIPILAIPETSLLF